MSQAAEKPLIGIAAESEAAAQPCAEVVERSGGAPRTVLLGRDLPPDSFPVQLRGLVVTGEEGPYSAQVSVLKDALENDMPVLCVGGGMHALNEAFDGDAGKDVSGHRPSDSDKDGEEGASYHRIYITPGSKLAAIVGSGGFVRVNSRHSQAIKEPQKSRLLLASAYSLDDGIIEALESPDHDWVIGVQFQPQRRLEIPPHFDRLFQGLVERAAR